MTSIMPQNSPSSTRRDFLKTSTAAGTTAALAASFSASPKVFAQGDDTLKVGLVGCGGRGTGAAGQALAADKGSRLVAVADAFPEQIERALSSLKRDSAIEKQVQVEKEQEHVGLDGYKAVIEASDVVLLCTPPGFRPVQLKAAVEAGKHVFTEKPMATDMPGARSCLESVKLAKEKGLAMVAGFCWRYDEPRRELFRRIHDGQIGDVQSIYGTYLTGPVKPMPPADTRPSEMSDLEWQVRNWYNFCWLSGDGLAEQACHTVDWLMWAKGDEAPLSCTAVGGRQIPAEGGNIYDHVEVNYVWEDGTRGHLAQRQITGCHNENSLRVLGSQGTGKIERHVEIEGAFPWRWKGQSENMYQIEHNELFASIRAGKPLNDGDRMMTSTIAAIMGREAGYTGEEVTWEMIMNSQLTRVPEITSGWDTPVQPQPLAMPGRTQFV
jgi:myo-inositol 2-dehydrogenase / D-chiro-inositol 1-dehydrogenase